MSYRDLRNFTEMMKALGYPRLISMDNFRTPNFSLVAEVLIWLINRYDPTADLPTDIDTEQDRVIFIKSTAQFLASKAHLKLNTKKLYSADGHAVKELLKVSTVLYSAMRSNRGKTTSSYDDSGTSAVIELITQTTDVKVCRQLASQVTAKGAKLYGLLGKEIDLREQRKAALSKAVDIDMLEKGVKDSIATVQSEIQKVTTMLNNLASDEANLSVKIEKKKQDLERNHKRLRSLSNVRPAFMDEYEKLEVELSKQYEAYMEKHCNLCYLENLQDQHNKAEQGELEATEHSLRKVQMRMAEAEKKMMQDDIISDDMLMVAHSDFFKPAENATQMAVGTMDGGGGESDNDSGSLSSDSDLDDSVGGEGHKVGGGGGIRSGGIRSGGNRNGGVAQGADAGGHNDDLGSDENF